MPRTAVVILGFALVALSIGFNAVQYPVVWEMTAPILANEAAQPAVKSSPEKPESLASAQSPQPSSPSPVAASRSDVDTSRADVDKKLPHDSPRPQAGEGPGVRAPGMETASNSQAAQTNSPDPTDSATDMATAAGPETRKPLVPVTPVRLPAVSDRGLALAAGVRRLPPVDSVNSGRATRAAPAAFHGTLPAYPTTGTP